MTRAKELLQEFQSTRGFNYGEFEDSVPIYVSPLYKAVGSDVVDEITICSPQTRIKDKSKKPSLYFTACQDIEINFLRQSMAKNILYYYFSLFGDIDNYSQFQNRTTLKQIRDLGNKILKDHNTSLTQKGDQLDVRKLIQLIRSNNFKNGMDYLNDIMSLDAQNYIGFIVLIRDDYIKPISGYQKLLFSWEYYLNKFKKQNRSGPVPKNITNFITMAEKLTNTTKTYLDSWHQEIQNSCSQTDDSMTLETKCIDAIVNYELDLNKTKKLLQIDNIKIGITFGDGNYVYKKANGQMDTTTILKIGIVFPAEMLRTTKLKEDVARHLKHLTYLQLICMASVILIGTLILRYFSERICSSLDNLVQTFKNIESNPRYEYKDDAFLNDCSEVSEVYSSFLLLKKSFDEAFDAFKSGNQTESLLKYSMALSLYKKVNNYGLAGIICNNIGNIHLNSGKIEEAIRMYEQAIHYAEKLDGSKNQNSLIMRKMNLALALREKSMREFYNLDPKKTTTKQRVKKKDIFTKMEKIVRELFRFFKDEEDNYYSTIYACMLCYIYLQMNNFRLAKIFVKEAQLNFDTFKQEKPIWRHKGKFEIFELNKVFLSQEILLIQAETSLKRGDRRQAADILTECIKKGKKFSFSIRKRLIYALEKILLRSNLRMTKSLIDLKRRINFDEKQVCRNFIFLLDYSKSMLKGRKIENAVKAILKIWDMHIGEEDNVAFVRYNLNPEVVFGLDKKKINEFSKRHQIELSLFPKDRTALYDALYKGMKMAKKRKFRKNQTYLILICDGDDFNSVIKRHELCEKMMESRNVLLICVGLALTRKDKDSLKEIVRFSLGGQLIEPNGSNFDILFQMLSSYMNKYQVTEFFEENL